MNPALVAAIIAGALLLTMFLGLPVSFSLMGVSIICYLIFLGPSSLIMAINALVSQLSVEVYLAIPLFIFMAALMQFSGLGQQIYDALSQWMGRLRGGLAIAMVIACAIIAALSGIGATGTAMMGLVALPEMYKHKYNPEMVLGAIAAGGALGPLIPPSVLMIIVAGYADLSVGKLFLGGVMPGFLVTLGYCLYIGIRCYLRPQDGPSLPDDQRLPLEQRIRLLKNIALPILLAIAIMILIYTGVCTPTEASAIGAFGALVFAGMNKKLNWPMLKNSMALSLKINGMVMWILMGGGCYAAIVTASGTSQVVSDMITSLALGPIGTTFIMILIPFVMGMFIDPIAIVMICVPIFLVICKAMALDLLWVMLLVIVSVIIGYISPPFGVNLFYMKGVAPAGTKIADVYRGVIPFVIIKTLVMLAGLFIPLIYLFLPNSMMK